MMLMSPPAAASGLTHWGQLHENRFADGAITSTPCRRWTPRQSPWADVYAATSANFDASATPFSIVTASSVPPASKSIFVVNHGNIGRHTATWDLESAGCLREVVATQSGRCFCSRRSSISGHFRFNWLLSADYMPPYISWHTGILNVTLAKFTVNRSISLLLLIAYARGVLI